MNNNDFLSLLSMVMDESLNDDDIRIQKNLNAIKMIIEEQLLPSIERIQYVEKYKIIETMKAICRNISLYLYCPGLIGKNVVCFYHPRRSVSKKIYSRYLKKTISSDKELEQYMDENSENLGKKKNRNLLMDDVPMFLTNDANRTLISFLNVANKSVDASYKEYISLLNHSRRQNARLTKIIDWVYVPVVDNMGDMAISVIPSGCDNFSRYNNTICDTADVLVIQGIEATKDSISKFKNVNAVFLQGKVSSSNIVEISSYCNENGIHLFKGESDIFERLEKEKNSHPINNFCYKYYVENQLYEISWYLAKRKARFEQSIAKINEDLVFKEGDLKAGEMIKKIQIQYGDIISEIDSLYVNYKLIIEDLIKRIDALQNEFGIHENPDFLNNHIPMQEIAIQLFAKVETILNEFPESNAKEKVRNYKALCNSNKDPLVEAIFDKYINKKTSQYIIDLAINKKYQSDFIKRIQVQMGIENNVDVKKLSEIVASIHTEKLPIEYYVLGKGHFLNSEKNEAYNNLLKAAKGGIEEAGEMLVDNFDGIEEKTLEELADHGVPSAAFIIGKKYVDSNNRTCFERGMKYLHIAASKNSINAIKYLGDLSFNYSLGIQNTIVRFDNLSGDNVSDNENETVALKYYLIAEKKGFKDSKMFERIAKIYFSLKNYNETEIYCIKANTAETNYWLGMIYEEGLGRAKDEKKALQYYQNSLKHGHMNAQAAYKRLTAKIEKRKKKKTVKENKDYNSYSEYENESTVGGW